MSAHYHDAGSGPHSPSSVNERGERNCGPRGCALYIIPRKSLDDGKDVNSCYSSIGVSVHP